MYQIFFITSGFVVLAFVISLLGVQMGDNIIAELPGGKAGGVVAGVILLLSVFIQIYKYLNKTNYNVLNKEALVGLLNIYFTATANDIIYTLETEFENNKSITLIDEETIERIKDHIKRTIKKSRANLSHFHYQKKGKSLLNIINKDLSDADLEKLILDAIYKFSKIKNPTLKRRYAYKYISGIQEKFKLKLIEESCGK